jgi:hypothetical protein
MLLIWLYLRWYEIGAIFISASVIASALLFIVLWIEAKQKVADIPKVPTTFCDKHGLIPTADMLHYDFVQEDGSVVKVEECPECRYEQMMKVNKKIVEITSKEIKKANAKE